MTYTQTKKELTDLLNNSRTGLKDSSDTNKTRYNILALFDKVREDTLREKAEEIKKKWKEVRLGLAPDIYKRAKEYNDIYNQALSDVLSIINKQ